VTDLLQAQSGEALGAFIREQRKRASLSLRQLAELTSLSNPYLSQAERGLRAMRRRRDYGRFRPRRSCAVTHSPVITAAGD
jgi:Helix-turn-helix domain